jgi:2'-5' RNA ligase
LPARHRLFVAVWPPEELLGRLEDLERPHVPGLRWTTRDQWHVTLRFLGSVAGDDVRSVAAALDGLRGATPTGLVRPVVAITGSAPRLLGRGVWMLPVSGLESLAGVVGGLLDAADRSGDRWARPPDRLPFTGHLTLARARRPSALKGLPAPAISSSWPVREVTLVSSSLTPDGAKYTVLERWQL